MQFCVLGLIANLIEEDAKIICASREASGTLVCQLRQNLKVPGSNLVKTMKIYKIRYDAVPLRFRINVILFV